MVSVIAFDDVKASRRSRIHEDGKWVAITDFITPNAEQGVHAQAMLVEEAPHRNLRVHYHEQDEFQIFVSGNGTNGRHPIKPFQLHFARAFTPYGPILADDLGCAFLTLRSRTDRGAKFMPESRPLLEGIDDRHPWQTSADVEFPDVTDGAAARDLPNIHDDNGLHAQALRIAPGAKCKASSPAGTDGQYLAILRGSLIYQGREHPSITIVFLESSDDAFELEAGSDGLDALVMNLPQHASRTPSGERKKTPQTEPAVQAADDGELQVWTCVLCGFIYDEAEGMPEEGIAPGTRWKDVPESFGCPDCAATKADFEMVAL